MIEIRMPRLSEAMTEGKLLLWNVAVGDTVEQGDQLAEVEADKANMEIEAPVSGIVLNLHGKPGDKIAVETVLVELQESQTQGLTDAQAAKSKPKADKTAQDDAAQEESPLQRREKNFQGKGI